MWGHGPKGCLLSTVRGLATAEAVQLLLCRLQGSLGGGMHPPLSLELGLTLQPQLPPQPLQVAVVLGALLEEGSLVGGAREEGTTEEGPEAAGFPPHGSNPRHYIHAF